MGNTMKKAAAFAAAGAAAISVSDQALAGDAAQSGDHFILSLEGDMLFADPAINLDKLGSGGPPGAIDIDNHETLMGYRGAARFGQVLDSGWDWQVGVSYANFLRENGIVSISGGSASGFFSTGEDISYLTGDIELGRHFAVGDGTDLRLFAGLRMLNSNDSLDKGGAISSGGSGISFDVDIGHEFLGVGPRAGLDFTSRLGDGPLGISGMAAGAILFGKSSYDIEFTATSGGLSTGGSFGDSESDTLYNLEAALGLDYHVSDRSMLTVGYRGEYWNNMRGDKLGDGGEFDNDLFAHGPFAKFTVMFD